MSKLYANIGIAHENNTQVLEQRVIAAAQCNADAVVINKSTPHIVIPDEKRYVAIQSRWGTKPYIEVAKLSELDASTTESLMRFCEQIGIPIIWSVTDTTAADFVKEHTGCSTIKMHHDSPEPTDLAAYCHRNFTHVIYNVRALPFVEKTHGVNRRNFQVYYTTDDFPPSIEQLSLSNLDGLIRQQYSVGYESRDAGIFPAAAVAYKGVDYVEKYLGDPDSTNPAVLTPDQFYDFYKYLEILSVAQGADL